MDQLREDSCVSEKCPPYQYNFQNTSSSIQTDYKHTVPIKVGWVLNTQVQFCTNTSFLLAKPLYTIVHKMCFFPYLVIFTKIKFGFMKL